MIKTTKKSWFRQLVGGITVGPSSPRTINSLILSSSIQSFYVRLIGTLRLMDGWMDC